MGGPGDDRRRAALVASVWAVWFAVAMEWLFTATMPSFMDSLTPGERLRILLVAPLLLALPALALAWLLGWVVPAAVLACTALLLIDNFTYTLFRIGIASTRGAWRAAYGVLLVGLVVVIYRALRRSADRFRSPALGRATAALLLAAGTVAAWRWARTTPDLDLGDGAAARRRPNILILSTDGLDASHMSAYGYRRDTTPFIRTLVPRALVAENAFPNGTITVASLVSLLTGKSPIRTRVYSTKDALLGAEEYQSLPAILRRTGYATIALVPGVVDPVGQNLRDAFDVSNARALQGAVPFPALPDGIAVALAPEVYFLRHAADRLSVRLVHVIGRRAMTNPLWEVTTPADASDARRVRALIRFVARAPGPVFGLVHLMGTHGPFAPRHRRWSLNPADSSGPYDDSILDYDRHVARIVRAMARLGRLDDTIVVVTSDHASLRRPERIPLIMGFPQGEHRGRIVENVQLMDLAPTLLDQLGIPVPGWMEGRSLLAPRPDRRRPIITVDVFRGAPGGERMTMLALTVCDRSYELDFFHDTLATRAVAGHTAGCLGEWVPDPDEARRILAERLRANDLEPEEVVANVRELEMVNANLAGAHLAGARLAGRFLNGANLTGATLAGADLVGTTFANANLTDADLTGADMRRARLHQANLTRAKLSHANLEQARLPSVRAPDADLSRATLRSAWLQGADLSGANLEGVDATGANMSNAKLVGTRLRGAILVNAVLGATDLTRADLRDANLTGASIRTATTAGADLTGAKRSVSP
jgi:uncharacterized protein YjbI with pentapeptide repeats